MNKAGRQLHQALLQAGRAGARVDVLVDGWGSPDLPDDVIRTLTEAGVRRRVFDPVRRL
jgi:cardiolipin synthase